MSVNMETAEEMAVQVLKGSVRNAIALAHHLVAMEKAGDLVLPIAKLDVPLDRLRIVVFMRDNAMMPDQYSLVDLTASLTSWARGDIKVPLVLGGVERIEFYELPEVK